MIHQLKQPILVLKEGSYNMSETYTAYPENDGKTVYRQYKTLYGAVWTVVDTKEGVTLAGVGLSKGEAYKRLGEESAKFLPLKNPSEFFKANKFNECSRAHGLNSLMRNHTNEYVLGLSLIQCFTNEKTNEVGLVIFNKINDLASPFVIMKPKSDYHADFRACLLEFYRQYELTNHFDYTISQNNKKINEWINHWFSKLGVL